MKILDAWILARTKRKTRRIRTTIVVCISSLLFAVLFAGAFAATGLNTTVGQVKDVGFNGQNLTQVIPLSHTDQDMFDPKVVQAKMDTELRARGIKVTDATHQDASYIAEFGRRIAAQQSENVKNDTAKITAWTTEHIGQDAHIYELGNVPSLGFGMKPQTSADPDPFLTSTKASIESGDQNYKGSNPYEDGLQFFSAPNDMMKPELQPGQSTGWKSGEAFPLFVPYSYLEQLSGHSTAKLSTARQNQVIASLIKKYRGQEISYCYRNGTAQNILQSVLTYNFNLKTKKTGETPVAVNPCGTFTKAELKKVGINQDGSPISTIATPKPLFASPAPVAPITQVIKFKLVGFFPAPNMFDRGGILTQILNAQNNWPAPIPGVVPTEVVKSSAILSDSGESQDFLMSPNIFVNFPTRAAQKQFEKLSCHGNECGPGNKPLLQSFGNINTALESITHGARNVLLIVAGVVGIIAAVTMLTTVSKIISDSRKEIAIFRAVGARRHDIAEIYLTYGFSLFVMALVFAVILALVACFILGHYLASSIAAHLVEATGAYLTNVHVSLIGWHWSWLGLIAAILLATSLIGMLIPIFFALRKRLINILREE